jgi:tetratricopeptide (TPR) repeat protein
MTLNNLANLHKATQQLSLAEEEYREALDTYRTLAAGNPQAYLPDVAMTLNNLAVLHKATQQLSLAEEEYREALDIRRTLAERNPPAFQLDFATTLINFSIFHIQSLPDNEKSLDYALQAFLNALPYHDEVPLAQKICQMSIQIWQHWGEDLQKYLQEKD